jgi:hypothetical protein
MKNIFLISSDIPVRYYGNHYVNQNVYITSDEDIKDGDIVKIPCGVGKVKDLHWKYGNDNPSYIVEDLFVYKLRYGQKENELQTNSFRYEDVKKIILATDTKLIKDGVQEIDEKFLKWFVDNPTCEEVKVGTKEKYDEEIVLVTLAGKIGATSIRKNIKKDYKIIIPKKDLGYTTKMGIEVSDEMVRETMIPKDRFDDYHYKETFESRQYYIPKEEPKQEFPFFDKEKSEAITKEGQKIVRELQSNIQQETLEEAFKRMQKIKVDLDYPSFHLGTKWQKEQFTIEEQHIGHTIDELDKSYIKGFNEGSDWQEKRMCSKEEVLDILEKYDREFKIDTFAYQKPCSFTVKKWFEQIKK